MIDNDYSGMGQDIYEIRKRIEKANKYLNHLIIPVHLTLFYMELIEFEDYCITQATLVKRNESNRLEIERI